MIIGLDVGGTHTDVVLIGQSGLIKEIKVPTDPSDLFATVLEGLEKVTHGIDPKEIRRAVLSTTLTTNCVVQKNTIPVGMLVSAGPGIDPEFFRTGDHYHAVSGSIDHRGREVEPIRAEEIRSAGAKLKDAGIRYVGVVSKFSVRNPAHEQQIHDLLDGQFDKIFLGHRVSGNLNFPRRIATTYLNAAVYPIHKDFFEAVQRSLDKKGLSIPIRILKPDGGNMRFSASIEYPAQTILSGPAASIMGSIAFAPKNHESLVLDIGGTTTDMAVLLDGVPLLAPLGIEIGEYRTVIRSLLTRSIGLGGDSACAQRKSASTDRLGNAGLRYRCRHRPMPCLCWV
jgi:N-methylhydantoinase A/oxoprolinase/acetone carboxylase beta subunit